MKCFSIFLIVLLALLPSCNPEVENKGKYENYLIGMYINGVEYHEISGTYPGWGTPPVCGFRYLNKPQSNNVLVLGGIRDLGARDNKHDRYEFAIYIYADSTLFKSNGAQFLFDNCSKKTGDEVFSLYKNNATVDSPKWVGYLYNYDKGIVHYITYGWIQYYNLCTWYSDDGNMDNRGLWFRNVFFEFMAKSEDGDVISITDGYCKYGESR